MIVGLGNPGRRYARTRHNAGFMVLDEIARAYSIPVEEKTVEAVVGCGSIEGIGIVLVKPMAYMNRSGPPVRRLADRMKISTRDMVVIHDDIDLQFGRLKIKQKGGDGGHRGLRSIVEALGGGDFSRLRIGIGRSAADTSVTDYVLERFDAGEKEILDQIVECARDAVVTIFCEGVAEAMNSYNTKQIIMM